MKHQTLYFFVAETRGEVIKEMGGSKIRGKIVFIVSHHAHSIGSDQTSLKAPGRLSGYRLIHTTASLVQ